MSGKGGELERTLGFLEAMTLGGGTMIGAGIFILPGIAARNAGPASSVSYAIAGLVALLAALSLSELATGMPIAGGSYHYVNRALGGLFGAVVGWGMWTGLMFASAFYMVGFGQYVVGPLPGLDGRTLVVLVGLAGLAALIAVNYYGTDESSALQNVMIGTETAIVIVFVAISAFFIDMANLETFAPTGSQGIIATTGIVFVSFLGFEIIATVAGEIKNPGRTVPLSMLLSVVSVTLLYVVVMLVSTGVVPYDQLGQSPIPVSDVAEISMGTLGVAGIAVAAVIAAISSSNSSILAASRVVYAMGRDGVVTDWLNASHERFYTPHRAIMVTGGLTAVLVLIGLRIEAIIALLAEAASFSFLVSYSLVHVAVVVFRLADPDEYEPSFEIPALLYPAVPILGVILSLVVITQMAPVVISIGVGIIALGVGWHFAYARSRVVSHGMLREAVRQKVTEPYRVVVPIANPETQHGLLRLAAASAHAHADRGLPELVAVNVVEGPPDAPRQNLESDRLDHQQNLLENAHEIAESLDVHLRTRSIIAPDIGHALLEVIDEEEANQVLVGWDGTISREEYAFGSVLDPLASEVRCHVSLVNLAGDTIGTTVGLVAPGPNGPAVAHRTAEFATVDGTVPTLLHVSTESDGSTNRSTSGHGLVEEIAEAADLEPGEYEIEVIESDDVVDAIVDASDPFDTVCVGLSHRTDGSRIVFGEVTERVAEQADRNVALVRGAKGVVDTR